MITPKILIVDDEPVIRLTMQRLLGREGYAVTTVASGVEALEICQEQEFDLALLDINLDDELMDGIDVLMTIREQTPDTVVIILTGQATVETSVQSLRQGAHDYLCKPCPTQQLKQSVRTGLQSRQQKIQQRQLIAQLTQNLEGLRQVFVEATPVALPNDGQGAGPSQPFVNLPQPTAARGTTTPPANGSVLAKEQIRRGALQIDTTRQTVWVNNTLLNLSPTEFEVMSYLADNAPRPISAEELVRQALGYESEAWEANNTARQYIHRLRQKVKQVTETTIIRTVRGRGYAVG